MITVSAALALTLGVVTAEPISVTVPARAAGDAGISVAAVPTETRLAGADLYETAVAASRSAYPSGSDVVMIASGLAVPDTLTAAAIAGSVDGPVLYVASTSIPVAVITELRRLAPAKILVVGGPVSVSPTVLATLGTLAPDVQRFDGADRFAASRSALTGYARGVSTVYIADGIGYLDAAIAAATAGATKQGALLVSARGKADAATIAALRAVGATNVVGVGGTATLSAAYLSGLSSAGFSVSRLVGADRYQASILLARHITGAPQRAIIANSMVPADVAVAAGLAAVTGQPLYYARTECLPDVVAAELASAGTPTTLVGGTDVLEDPVASGFSCTKVRSDRQAQLTSELRTAAAKYDGTFSVTVRQVGGVGEFAGLRDATRVEPASMMKIFAAWGVLKTMQNGRGIMSTRLASGFTIWQCLNVMIHNSDNLCHDDIVRWVGAKKLTSMFTAAGFANTYYGTVPSSGVLYARNRTTTNDLTLMVTRLAAGTMLDATRTSILLNLMKSQIGRSRLASGIPPGIVQASKPGALWLASGLLQADTGIVYGPRSAFVISVVATGGVPASAISALTRVAYEHFNGEFGAAMSYPAQQVVTKNAARVRTSPAGTVITTLPVGYALQVGDSQHVWYQVRYGSRLVWIDSQSLKNRPPY